MGTWHPATVKPPDHASCAAAQECSRTNRCSLFPPLGRGWWEAHLSLVPTQQKHLCLWSCPGVSCTLKHQHSTAHRPNPRDTSQAFIFSHPENGGRIAAEARGDYKFNKQEVKISLQTGASASEVTAFRVFMRLHL